MPLGVHSFMSLYAPAVDKWPIQGMPRLLAIAYWRYVPVTLDPDQQAEEYWWVINMVRLDCVLKELGHCFQFILKIYL